MQSDQRARILTAMTDWRKALPRQQHRNLYETLWSEVIIDHPAELLEQMHKVGLLESHVIRQRVYFPATQPEPHEHTWRLNRTEPVADTAYVAVWLCTGCPALRRVSGVYERPAV